MMRRRRARIYRPTPRNLRRLAACLRRGELVAVPSETVYGLAANALDAAACRAIFAAKRRPAEDPLIVHIHSLAQLHEISEAGPEALRLAAAFWPGPLTLVLPKKAVVPDLVTAGRPSVAVRMPAHPVFRRLLKLTRLPVAAPSANPFGYVSPTTAGHVADHLGQRINAILDGGSSNIGLESTIVDLRDPRGPRLLRPGAISAVQIGRVLRRAVECDPVRRRIPRGAPQLAPGMLSRHYSPATRVLLHTGAMTPQRSDEAYVFLRKPAGRLAKNVFWLSSRGELRVVARQLFATLRRLDTLGFRRIHVQRATGEGLAAAINDRLERAAAR